MNRAAALNRVAALSFALLFASTTLAAQSAGQQTQTIILQVPNLRTGCPVSLHAQQSANGGNLLAVDKTHHRGMGQGLHLILAYPDSRRIVAANLTVRGLSAKNRLIQTISSQNSSDAIKNLDITLQAGRSKNAAADIWVPGMTSVQTIELNSVTYDDGSIWKFDAGDVCRTVPDGIMQVASR